jgi:FtsH-binding integral membrane protein
LLGLSAALFIRLRQRLSKVAILLGIGMGSTMIAGWTVLGANQFFNLLLISAIPISTVLVPAALATLFVHRGE